MTSMQEHNCIFCEESFDNKEALQIHFRKHGDPKFNPNKTKGRVQSTVQVCSDSSKDETEMVGCDVCSEMFTTISKAITHKHKVHPEHDAKYFCPWCGKLFTMKHLYNKHMQANHENLDKTEDNTFHCDVCNVDFNLPAALIHHNRFYHRQDTDIPAFGHSKKVKMYNQGSLPIYYCSFCGEEYENKVNLHKHSNDDHNDENQSPDVVLRCPLCDAIFYHLDAYELHLTFHTKDDLYSERSEMADDVSEFSLESVPPIMEKVENCDLQQDAETTVNEMGIEDFLEQVLEEPDVGVSKKNKKHRKHKKSKKAAITLDEFLNMNKDVFGEGLDFQGVEEVPTRVITKRLKVVKKTPNTVSEITPELQKLQKHGIVIKRKSGQNISIPIKDQQNKPLKADPKAIPIKVPPEPRVSTSEDTIDKLLNQTNNQIKIVKKSNKDISSDKNATLVPTKFHQEPSSMECDSTKKDIVECLAKDVEREDMPSSAENNEQKQDVDETITNTESHDPADETVETQYDDFDIQPEEKEAVSQNEVEKFNELSNNSTKVESTSNSVDNNLENTDYKLHNKHKKDGENPINVADTVKQSKIDSLSTLKRLSHLITVKTVSPSKNISTTDSDLVKNNNIHIAENNEDATHQTDSIKIPTKSTNETDSKETYNLQLNRDKSLPLKSSQSQPKSDSTKSITQEKENSDLENKFNKSSKQICNTNTIKNLNSSELIQSEHVSTNTGKTATSQTNYNDIEKQNTTNLLKHLTGITAKPINIVKSEKEKNTSLPPKNINNRNVRKIFPQREIINNEEIEIYNIDDSDDEIDQDSLQNRNVVNNSTKPTDVLKHLSKNITVKSLSHSIHDKSKTSSHKLEHEKISDKRFFNTNETQSCLSNEAHVTESELPNKIIANPISEKDIALKNAIKNLSKNVTLKSSNTKSTLQSINCHDQNMENCKERKKDSLQTVKITDITEDGCNDELENDNVNDNAVVESPEDSCSDKEHEETDIEEADFESQIKANMLKKDEECIQTHSSEKRTPCEDIAKQIPEKIVENENIFEGNLNFDIAKTLGNQISIKPVKQVKKEVKHENITNTEQICEQSTSNLQLNQKIDVSNQIKNIVNKQVTVKTFQTQTKTVIQEITTTVTKTIKTVNQTLKKEVQNNYSSTSTLPQKVQGMRVNPQSRNLQGIVVRHSSPPVRPKIGSSPTTISAVGTTVRHSSQVNPVGTSVRPVNQIVPIRPRSNVVRQSNPRMPNVQKVRPSTSNHSALRVGRPLKVSPEAVAVAVPVKRLSFEDASGPFSCFKKPKESLIPVSDVPTFSNSECESRMEYTSTYKSNSMNATATLKGNSVITSTQAKSEVSTSSQQLSRLNNTSGIKVTKISQNKQAQVQETSEISATQRTTLAAIQKLQKQGLLVKKPRLDLRQNSDGSDHSGCNSTDEND